MPLYDDGGRYGGERYRSVQPTQWREIVPQRLPELHHALQLEHGERMKLVLRETQLRGSRKQGGDHCHSSTLHVPSSFILPEREWGAEYS